MFFTGVYSLILYNTLANKSIPENLLWEELLLFLMPRIQDPQQNSLQHLSSFLHELVEWMIQLTDS